MTEQPSNTHSLTTVQLAHTPGLITKLPYGQVRQRQRTAAGQRVTLAPGSIAAYCVFDRRVNTFVFRVLQRAEPGCTRIVGVSPAVRLLLSTHTPGRHRKVRDLFLYLERQGRVACELSDGFFVRVATLLAGRLPAAKVLQDLVEEDDARR